MAPKLKLHYPQIAENSFISNLVVENLDADPSLSNINASGRIWYNRTEKIFKAAFLNSDNSAVEAKPLTSDYSNIFNSLTHSINTIENNFLDKTSLNEHTIVASTNFSNDVQIDGNLIVKGTQTILNTEIVQIADNTITLNHGVGENTEPTENAGIEVDRGIFGKLQIIQWNETGDYVEIYSDGVLRRVATIDMIDTLYQLIIQELSDRENSVNIIKTEIDHTQTGAGLNTDGSYNANLLANYISAATSLNDADNILDSVIKSLDIKIDLLSTRTSTLEGEVSGKIGDLNNLQTLEKTTLVGSLNELITKLTNETDRAIAEELDLRTIITSLVDSSNTDLNDLISRINALNESLGITSDTFVSMQGTNYLATSTSFNESDRLLDATIKTLSDNYSSTDILKGSSLVGFSGYTENDASILNPINLDAGTLINAINQLTKSVNKKIDNFDKRYVKGEIQSENISDSYTISHNLNTVFVEVTVQVFDVDENIWRFDLLIKEVIDSNTIKISMASGQPALIRYIIQAF